MFLTILPSCQPTCCSDCHKHCILSLSSALPPRTGTEANAANTGSISFIILFQKRFACIPVNSFTYVLTHLPITALDGISGTRILTAGTVTAFRFHRHSAFQRSITKHCCKALHRASVRSYQTAALADPAESRQMRSCPMAENTVKPLF